MGRERLDPWAMPTSLNDSVEWTTNAGTPVVDNDHSLTVGQRGPVLLEDYHLLEKLAQFDRERIPERVVHARGMSAKGYFEVTHDVTDLTFASFLSEVGKKTDLTARFSTVVHERGSPETMRDVRGFSVKVGNNIPVFFVRDAIKFPDLVHSLKPSPRKHVQEGWRILDFLSHHPESCHILTWLLDDTGIPKNYRQMPGFGVHTFKMINEAGKETYVKFHWKTQQGEATLTNEDADEKEAGLGPKKPVTATLDLFEHIEEGDFPVWELLVQTMDIEKENDYEFDPLDATKTWPEDQFPLRPVGKMVLDKNVDNWFTDNEMLAFNPGITVPGIMPSDDKLLQGRIFSYSDTQRYRLGANYQNLPINRPHFKYHQNHYDGQSNIVHRTEEIDYYPSRNNKITVAKIRGHANSTRKVTGQRVSIMIDKENNFYQAGERIRSWDPERRSRFIENLMMWMSESKCTPEVRNIWLGYWTECDAALGKELRSMCEEKSLLSEE